MPQPLRRSELYSLPVGKSVTPAYVPESDLIADAAKFDFEGFRVLACFDDDDLLAVRLAFGRGAMDRSDFGRDGSPDRSHLSLQLEVIRRDGSLHWLPTGQFKAEQLDVAGDAPEVKLPGVFELAGWPKVHAWCNAKDGELEIDAQLDVRHVTVLPDHLTRHNLIGRWVALAAISATVRCGESSHELWGLAFCDRLRAKLRTNTVPALSYYLHTPMRFDDGSSLIACYTEDARGMPIVTQCFGLYHDAEGGAHFLPLARVTSIEFDLDRKPTRWTERFEGDGLVIELQAQAEPVPVARAWGSQTTPQTRKALGDLPLVFTVEGTLRHGGAQSSLRGEGIGEHVTRRG